MLDDGELIAWLRLLATPHVGRESARKLLAAFGSAEAIFSASPATLRPIAGGTIASALASKPEGFDDLAEATRQWLVEDQGFARHLITIGDPAYPQLLLQTADPPLLLHVLGRIELLNTPSLAIVGSRSPTSQGLDNARAFAAHLGAAGHAIVSGMALGIDAAAHEGALDAGAATIAVVATGLDRVYPKRHASLARRIAEHGVLVSEFLVGMPALATNFPQRNRLIAGLAQGTLVVEAALQSGSLITARLAAEAGREVFAIPGSIHSPLSRGCHALIRQGAKLVESANDVLEELKPGSSASPAPAAEAAVETDPLLRALGHDPVALDALIARTGWPAAELNVRLLELELEGRLARLPGQLFQRRANA